MADITVRMIFNTETGKKDIWIDFESDEDALPHEHEKRHRQIVEQLLGRGVFTPDELGEVHVSRGRTGTVQTADEPATEPAPAAQKLAEGSGKRDRWCAHRTLETMRPQIRTDSKSKA